MLQWAAARSPPPRSRSHAQLRDATQDRAGCAAAPARPIANAAGVIRKDDVLVTYGTPGTLVAKSATTTIPIVMVHSGDAVATVSSGASRGQAGTSPE